MNDVVHTLPSLGRLESPDARDEAYHLRRRSTFMQVQVVRKTTHWPMFRKVLNQGTTSSCVGMAWKQFLMTAPIVQTKPTQEPTAFTIYREAIKLDQWTDNDLDAETMAFGTSVRAGAQALQARGFLQEYNWCFDIDSVIDWLCIGGPIVLGTSWLTQMFYPSSEGVIKASGAEVGGHAYLASGVNMAKGLVRIRNSWGNLWGKNGHAWISFEDLALLLARGGEACTSMEVRIPR